MAYIGRQLARGENKLFDDISSNFNGSTTTFTLAVSSVATATATPYQLFVSLGGVMQKPNTDFTTAGNQITFTTAPAAGLSCWIMMQGDTIDQAAIPDASVTPSKISGSNFAFSGDLRLKDADGSHYVGFASPSTVSTNKVWTLPAADGSASQYLQTNGSGVLTWATVSIGGATGIDFNDNVKARWGTGNDLEVFHNGSNSVINDAGTGDLLLQVGGTTQATISSTGVVIANNLTVSGTTTTINTQTLDVEDKNVVIGKVSSPSDTTADGGGWTLKGATDKTFNWVNATDAWTSSEHIHLIDNKKLLVGGASGTADGLEVVHDGSNSILNDTGTGALKLQLGGSTKLEITSGGIDVTGAITVDGSPLETAPTLTAVADGAIAANKAIGLTSAGKFKQIVEIKTPRNPQSTTGLTATTIESGTFRDPAIAFNPDSGSLSGSISAPNGLSLVTYRGGTNLYAEPITHSGTSIQASLMTKMSIATGVQNPPHNECIYMGDNYFLVGWRSSAARCRCVRFDGGGLTNCVEQTIESGGNDGTMIGFCRVSDTRAVAFFRVAGGGSDGHLVYSVLDFSGSGSGRTFTRTAMVTVDSSMKSTSKPKAILTNSGHIVLVYTRDSGSGQGRAVAGTISGSAGSGTISWGTNVQIASVANNVAIAYDSTNDVIGIKYKAGSGTGSGQTNAIHCSHNTSNNALTFGTAVSTGTDQEASDNEADMICSAAGYFVCTYRESSRQQVRGFTFSGTTPTWLAQENNTNNTIEYPRCTYDSVTERFVGVAANNSQNIVGGICNILDLSSSGTSGNFLGFSAGAYSDGNTATVNTFGNTATLSGLTTGSLHYVQNDGTINTTSSGAVCSVGTALSTTSLFIRDPS